MKKRKLLVFASGDAEGGGSGFENLVRQSAHGGTLYANIVGVVSNHEYGGVRARAEMLDVPFIHFPKPWSAENYQRIAAQSGAEFFALSGWVKWVKGLDLSTGFNERTVINIHPGPTLDFGGTGFYGDRVHKEVMEAYRRNEITSSAVTMHFVTEIYDDGPVFFECKVPIRPDDTPQTLKARVNAQEHLHQPRITSMVVNGAISWDGVDRDSLKHPEGYRIVTVAT